MNDKMSSFVRGVIMGIASKTQKIQPPPVELISFKIELDWTSAEGTIFGEFTAEKGMNWEDWVNSKYNNYAELCPSGFGLTFTYNSTGSESGALQQYRVSDNALGLWIFSSSTWGYQYTSTAIVDGEQYVLGV